jgi:predicted RNase H-like nuclease (RuvC/YqgF family)
VVGVGQAQFVIEVAVWYLSATKCYSQQVYRTTHLEKRLAMIGRFVLGGRVVALVVLGAGVAHAQDVPGIEICTVEKTMERRTSCLQSNVEFLQKTIGKLTLDHQQKLDAAKAQIEALKMNLTALQKTVSDLQAALQKPAGDPKKTDTPPAKETTAKETPVKETPAKETPKDGAVKEGGK